MLRAVQARDVVAAVLYRGATVLDGLISPKLPHVERLPWRLEQRLSITVIVTEVPANKSNSHIRFLRSGEVINKNLWIRFEACNHNRFSLPINDFDVHWQVVNTDQEAADADALRGDFYRSDKPGVRWESTSYHGAHWVEAFVVSKRTGTCWGRSGRFFVVIQ